MTTKHKAGAHHKRKTAHKSHKMAGDAKTTKLFGRVYKKHAKGCHSTISAAKKHATELRSKGHGVCVRKSSTGHCVFTRPLIRRRRAA